VDLPTVDHEVVDDRPPTGVAARNGFLPPRIRVYRGDVGEAGPIPLLTDLAGQNIAAAAPRIQLAHDGRRLLLQARSTVAPGVSRPDWPPGHQRFWEQDHIELRLQGESGGPHFQFILTPDGRGWDSAGLLTSGKAQVRGHRVEQGWQVEFAGDLAAMGLRSPGTAWGLVACTRWQQFPLPLPLGEGRGEGGRTHSVAETPSPASAAAPRPRPLPEGEVGTPEFMAVSPVELGFSQAERFARFDFVDAAPPKIILCSIRFSDRRLRRGHNAATLRIANRSREPITADLMGRQVTLPPGTSDWPVTLPLSRPDYTRLALCFGDTELAQVTLRAAADPAPLCSAGFSLHRKAGVQAEACTTIEHPYLLLTPDAVRELRRKADNPAFEPVLRPARAAKFDDQRQMQDRGGCTVLGDVGRCLAAWVVQADDRWIDVADRCVAEFAAKAAWPDETSLQVGNISTPLALAYDAFYPLLSDAQRRRWRDVLATALQLHLRCARRHGWNCTTIANANAVCNGGGGMAAMALLCEHPDAPEALDRARNMVRPYLDYCFGHDGGCTEGVQYWDYGLRSFLRFAFTMDRVLGESDGLLEHHAVRLAMNNVRVALCNDGSLHGVNDTIPMPVGGEIAHFVAGRFGDALGLWYGDHAARLLAQREDQGKPAVYGADPLWALLYRPDVPSPTAPPALPEAYCLRDIEYAIVRSSPRWDCALDAGIKGARPPYTHHNQADAGAVFIDVAGERLLIDPGYYKGKATDHSLPLIDGVGPAVPSTWTAKIIACESRGGLRYLACDATAAYGKSAHRVIRHMVMVGDRAVVLLDDIVPAGEGNVTAQYQCGGPTDLRDDGTVLIRGQRSALRLWLLNRPDVKVRLMPERDLHDTHWGYHFADCRMFPVLADYTADERRPLVSVFSVDEKAMVMLNGDGARISVLDGQAAFAFSGGRWRLESTG